MALSKKWIGHIEAWQACGLSQAYFCRQQQLNPKTFGARLCEYRRGQPVSPALIPVQVQVPTSEPLVLRHGKRLTHPPTQARYELSSLSFWMGNTDGIIKEVDWAY